MPTADVLSDLRRHIERIERSADPAPNRLCAAFDDKARTCGLSFGHAGLNQAFAEGGLSFGAHQIAGEGGGAAGAFAAMLLTRLARVEDGRPLLAVQERSAVLEGGDLYGPGLQALGLDPAAMVSIVAREGRQALRIADEALRSRAVAAVLVELQQGARRLDLALSQRFNLEAQRSECMLFLLTPDLSDSSAALSRWQVRASPSRLQGWVGPPVLDLDLVRNRRGRPGRWIVEWSRDETAFRDPAPFSSPVAAPPVDRPGAARRANDLAPGARRQGQGRAEAAGCW